MAEEGGDSVVIILAVIVDIWVTVMLTGGADGIAGVETQIRPRLALSDSPTTCHDRFGLISHKMVTQGGSRMEDPKGQSLPRALLSQVSISKQDTGTARPQ